MNSRYWPYDTFVLCPDDGGNHIYGSLRCQPRPQTLTGPSLATVRNVTSRQKLELCLLAGAVGLSRSAFRSHDLYDLDSVNFALGIRRFDPGVHQPHPPGYFLYVCLGRLINSLVHDANLALVIVSILAGIATVILIYRLALDWFGPRAATFAGLLFLFSPLARLRLHTVSRRLLQR